MDNKLRFAIVGKTGSGRSTLGNMILQRDYFPSFDSAASITDKCSNGFTTRDEKSIVVVDTPGILHTKMKPESVQKELQKVVQLLTPGPTAFLYTLRVARYSAEEEQTRDTLIDVFGEKFFKFCVIIILIENDHITDQEIAQYINKLPTFYLTLIRSCNKRVLTINNNSLDFERLLSLVSSIALEQCGPCYSIEMLQYSNSISKKIYRLLSGWIWNKNNPKKQNTTSKKQRLFPIRLIDCLWSCVFVCYQINIE